MIDDPTKKKPRLAGRDQPPREEAISLVKMILRTRLRSRVRRQ